MSCSWPISVRVLPQVENARERFPQRRSSREADIWVFKYLPEDVYCTRRQGLAAGHPSPWEVTSDTGLDEGEAEHLPAFTANSVPALAGNGSHTVANCCLAVA